MTMDSDARDALRLLIVDDHEAFRSGLRALLETSPGVTVTGEAASGAEAVALARRLQPDVVLMDLAMPGVDGVEATRQIVEALPHVAVLVLTMSDEDESILAALRAGARGFLLKGARRADLLRAIRSVAAGEAILGPAVARRLTGYLDLAARPAEAPPPFPGLTEREREILDLVARGRSNAEITAQLVVSPKTVRNHVSNIFSKLGVRDRAEAIVRAREAGMGGEGGRRG